MKILSARRLVLVLFETVLILAAGAAAAYARLGSDAWDLLTRQEGGLKILLWAGVTQVCLYYADLYDLRRVADRRELFLRVIQALSAASFILAAIGFLDPNLLIGRGVFVIAAAFVIGLVPGWRLLFDWAGRRIAPRERLLLVGTSAAAVTLARELFERRNELGVSIVGFVDPDPGKVGTPIINPGVIGTIDDIPTIVSTHGVDRVVVSLADARGKLPMDRLLEMRLNKGVAFDHLASVYEEYTGKIAIENLRPSWLIFSDGFRQTRMRSAMKRTVDVVAGSIGFVLLSPLMALLAILIRLTSKGPAFYHQQRVGANGRLFMVHKLRTMRVDAEATTGAVWAASNDPRVTRLGSFLRRTRLDEVPQLLNVIVGEMSLVGPRPERPEFVSTLTRDIPFYGLRHNVRPGLTGWAQVRYTYGATVEDALEKLQYDLYYIKHVTVAFDLLILFQTIKTVVLRRGAQ